MRDALHAAISACSEVYGDDDERTMMVRDLYDKLYGYFTRENRLNGWVIGIGFDDESEEYIEAEFTERPPPESEKWMRATIIKNMWL